MAQAKEYIKTQRIPWIDGILQKVHKKLPHMTALLTNVLRKKSFQWGSKADNCLAFVKEIMSSTLY